jgi:hypothetical protein
MFNLALRDDATTMYELNRSEMTEPVEFDGAPYIRNQNASQPTPQQDFIQVSPEDFQIDGEIDVEIGSTLADDDDSRVTKAQTTWSIASSSPNLFNMHTVRDETLRALGYGHRLHEFAAPPQDPPPPEKPRANVTVSFKAGEDIPPEAKEALLKQANLLPPEKEASPESEGQPGMAPFGPMPDLSPEEQAASVASAAQG